MMAITKNVFIVNCEKKVFEDYFSRKRNSDIINHHEIKQRLTNNDVFKTPPSPEVIEFQIIKRLNSFGKCKKSEFLFFFADSVNKDLIESLKSIFGECEFPINYHLLLENLDGSHVDISKEFCSIQQLDK
jgi:hypothetical protein